MDEKKLEKWLGGVDSRHRAVLVVSKRAKQIQKGLRPYFDSKTAKVTTMALEEFVKGKVEWYELSPEEVDAIHKESLTSHEVIQEVARPERPERLEKREIRLVDDFADSESEAEDEDDDDDDGDADSEQDGAFSESDE